MAINATSTDIDLMEEYDSLRMQACGGEIGEANQTPTEAVASEGWTEIRTIREGTNCPGTPVLARDLAGRLWLVNDLDGPWAIELCEEEN